MEEPSACNSREPAVMHTHNSGPKYEMEKTYPIGATNIFKKNESG